MRVIAGAARGRPLKAPPGTGTRPTSDKVKGAIFSMLSSMGVPLDRVLDLYAGSGALGIEALSRGAHEAVFVDSNPRACAIIRENLTRTGLDADASVWCLPADAALDRVEGPFDVVLVDPPYDDERSSHLLARLGAAGLVAPAGAVVYEHSKRTEPPAACGALTLYITRRYGDTCITIYHQEDV